VFSVIEVRYAGDLLYRQVDVKAAILNHPTAMQDAFDLGMNFRAIDTIEPTGSD